MLKVLLAYRSQDLGDAWEQHFGLVRNVEIVNADITTIDCDAVVSPANSFGFMDGGLDLALSERFGWDLQSRVRSAIDELPEQELLIGKSLVFPTNDKQIPWVVVSPTMRVPMSFNIASSVNAYLAKALLLAAESHHGIETIAVPGLCTGVGRMPAATSATQMYAAYCEIVLGKRKRYVDFGEAQRGQLDLNPNGMIWDF